MIDISDIGGYPDDEIIMVTTGSQGEPMSALARMSAGNHKQIRIRQEDTVILSSKFIPGNEKAIAALVSQLGSEELGVRLSALMATDQIASIITQRSKHELEVMYRRLRTLA